MQPLFKILKTIVVLVNYKCKSFINSTRGMNRQAEIFHVKNVFNFLISVSLSGDNKKSTRFCAMLDDSERYQEFEKRFCASCASYGRLDGQVGGSSPGMLSRPSSLR